MTRILGAAIAVAIPWAVLGQTTDASLRGPTLGFVFDAAARSVRPILGIPGAAILGTPLDAGVPIARAEVSPQQDAVLAVAGDDSRVFEIRLAPGSVAVRPLPDATPGPDQIVFSPAGTAAVLYHSATATLEIVSGLPDSPTVAGRIDLSSLAGSLTALAISDDAGAVLAAFSNADAGSVYLVDPSQGPRLVLSLHRAPSMVFLSGTHDALIADDLDSKVYLVSDVSGAAGATVVASADNGGLAAPNAVEASSDGALAIIASSQSGTITTVKLADGTMSSLSCACAPSSLHRLSGNFVFRLTDPSQGPMWLLDGDGPSAQTFFVPPDTSGSLVSAAAKAGQ